MKTQGFEISRTARSIDLTADIVVVGGGLTGVCCALTAARRGCTVILVQDRPVLGGNASSEVRLWALGATSHMGNNNRWSREGGVINEIMTENVYRNREGNPVIFDTVLLDKVMEEKNITLLLDTVVYDVVKSDASTVKSVIAYNPINETRYEISGKYFADCSGDGTPSYLAGVPYRMGAEDKAVYGEGFSPDRDTYGELLGHTIFFYMKDTGAPVRYVAPGFALKDVEKKISKIYNNEYFSIHHHGCKYWWIEYGGRLDTIHEAEEIKRELLKVVYGIWDYIKNSGKFPEMETYTLEWVGTIPGKRESRRMVGLYTLTQHDIVEQRQHYDAVSYGGWAIDLHPADGVYAGGRACSQWHSKGVYQIPYRCYLGSDIRNLMFGGRIISTSHVANGSTRVMCTSAAGGQVIGMALSLCVANNLMPADYADQSRIAELQRALIETGHYIPGVEIAEPDNMLRDARVIPSSTCAFSGFSHNGKYSPLNFSTAALLPVEGKMPRISVPVNVKEPTKLRVELRDSVKYGNFTPDNLIESREIAVNPGESIVNIDFNTVFEKSAYRFICFMANDKVALGESDMLVSGTATVLNQINPAVSNYGRQDAPEGSGFESFEFWCPLRRPQARNIAMTLDPPMQMFSTALMANTLTRPTVATNAWAADVSDENPAIAVEWDAPRLISEVTLFLDADYDHAMETVQMGHSESVMPCCIRDIEIADGEGNIIAAAEGNYQGRVEFRITPPVETAALHISHRPVAAGAVPAIFHVIVK